MILKVSHLKKVIQNQTILNDISFEIVNKEIISIIGHSGAGKTTLLRTLNGLTDITHGSIIYDNIKIDENKKLSKRDLETLHTNIGLVFQNFNLFPHLNILENLTIALTLKYKKDKIKIVQKAKYWLKLLELENKANHFPYQLSGGEKQRVAIARACMLNPKIICFDEPTSALDPHLVSELTAIIKQLQKANLTIIIITHDMNFAEMISDRVITLEKGTILSDIKKEIVPLVNIAK